MQWYWYSKLHSKDNCCLILIYNFICLTLHPLLDAQLLPQSSLWLPPFISHLIIWIRFTTLNFHIFSHRFIPLSHSIRRINFYSEYPCIHVGHHLSITAAPVTETALQTNIATMSTEQWKVIIPRLYGYRNCPDLNLTVQYCLQLCQ